MTDAKLPNVERARVPDAKITEYLLDVEHEKGRGKALFFIHFGFSMAQWKMLAQALVDHAQQNTVARQVDTRFGTRYVIEGLIQTPSGRTPRVRVVWFIPKSAQDPQLVTAYPLEATDDD
jgi:hypothetical protein